MGVAGRHTFTVLTKSAAAGRQKPVSEPCCTDWRTVSKEENSDCSNRLTDKEDPMAGIQKGLDNIKVAVEQQRFLYDKLLPRVRIKKPSSLSVK